MKKRSYQPYPSITYLQKKIKKLFSNEFGFVPSFPGYQCDLLWPSRSTIDVVLFGDACFTLMTSNQWPLNHSFRIWVLNESFKQGICKLFGIPQSKVSVIPRELLIERKKRANAFPRESKMLNLVCSTRLFKQKNLELTARLVHHLQKNYLGEGVKLYVFSPRHSKKEVASQLPELDWIKPPVLRGDKGPDWIKLAPKDSVYINLNLDPLDDFNVSCAQAQERGWPLILSARGPFNDIENDSAITVPLDLLVPKSGKFSAKELDELAMYIFAHCNCQASNVETSKLEAPEIITANELSSYRNNLPESHKEELKFYPGEENIWSRSVFTIWENL